MIKHDSVRVVLSLLLAELADDGGEFVPVSLNVSAVEQGATGAREEGGGAAPFRSRGVAGSGGRGDSSGGSGWMQRVRRGES